MVDYAAILSRAIASLNIATSELRHALYDRARRALIDKFNAGDSTFSQADLRAESAALEAAILRVEADAMRRAAPPPPPPLEETDDLPVEDYQDMAPLKDPRARSRMLAGVVGALVIAFIGAGGYFYGPKLLSTGSSVLTAGSTKKEVEGPASGNYVRLRQLVYYRTSQPAGTIVVDKSHTFLYVIRPNVSALRYSIGIGPECTTLAGLFRIVRKDEEQSAAAAARALYLNDEYRIHGGSREPANIKLGRTDCIRLDDGDFAYLYRGTPLENRVVVLE